jgi:hypothetical protein
MKDGVFAKAPEGQGRAAHAAHSADSRRWERAA